MKSNWNTDDSEISQHSTKRDWKEMGKTGDGAATIDTYNTHQYYSYILCVSRAKDPDSIAVAWRKEEAQMTPRWWSTREDMMGENGKC